MAQTKIIPRRGASQIFEGTPDEIAERLRGLNGATQLTLIIPGEEIAATQVAMQEHEPIKSESTFAQILAPAEPGFIESGMSETELDDFIEAEVKAYRAEKRVKGNSANG